jgi:molybdenum cofactor guanylyltransferase
MDKHSVHTGTKTIIILAGGRSSRIGRDKSLLMMRGRPVIEMILESVRPFFNEIIISTNNPESISRYGYKCAEDTVRDAGPVAGIMSVMQKFPREYYQVVACDTPFIEGAAAARVLGMASGADAVIVRTPDGWPQPLFSTYSIRCLPAFEDSIRNGVFKILQCVKNLNLIDITIENLELKTPWEKHFFNINTLDDIENATAFLDE